MATEETRLLRKSFDYLSTASIGVDPKSRECIVVLPTVYEECDNINAYSGFTIEELCPYMDDPWWRLLRRAILYHSGCYCLQFLHRLASSQQRCTTNSIKAPITAIYLPTVVDTIPNDIVSSTTVVTNIINNSMIPNLH